MIDAARLLHTTPEAFAAELVDTMLGSGAVVLQNGSLHAVAEHKAVTACSIHVPFPARGRQQYRLQTYVPA